MRFIPNENTWVGFSPTLTGTISAPKVADITGAVDLQPLVMGITVSTTGNVVPTPAFDTAFETSIAGTVTASFSMDFYRDNVTLADLAWSTFPRGTVGYVPIARYGGKPTTAGKVLEMWNIQVNQRSHANMSSNTPVSITVQASCPVAPDEDAVLAA